MQMKKIYWMLLTILFIGCGGGSSPIENGISDTESPPTETVPNETPTETPSLNENSEEESVVLMGKAQLGVLAKATVKLYVLNGLNQKLIATEQTSTGSSIQSIGNFNVHAEKLDDESYYIYEVSEGEDYDEEDDGIVNKIPIINRGVFHLLAKGSSIKAIQNIQVTLVSEIVYQKVRPFLDRSASEIEEKLKAIAKEIVAVDINGDGFVGREDVLRFDPVQHKSRLNSRYQTQMREMIINILNGRDYDFVYDPNSTVPPTVQDITLSVNENVAIGSRIGKIESVDSGDSEIINYTIDDNSDFEIDRTGSVKTLIFLDYELQKEYQMLYRARNHAGESESAVLTIRVNDLDEPVSENYTSDEQGIQKALDSADFYYVLTELINSREDYDDMNDDQVAMNIAGAYVGISGYTVYDITEAISQKESEDNSSFNGFIDRITKENDAVKTINALSEADKYYRQIVNGAACDATDQLSAEQYASCLNLGLIRLTSLSNSVKLLFGGDSNAVQAWANGNNTDASNDLNGNGIDDTADASACAIVYANNPVDSCRDGITHTYRGKVIFRDSSVEYNTTLIEVDVGSTEQGYHTFYKLITHQPHNNSPLLTNGICDRHFNRLPAIADGVTYFPCPALHSDGSLIALKESLEVGVNIQSLFPKGSQMKTTTENYIRNITGSRDGVIGLDNLSDYLQRH